MSSFRAGDETERKMRGNEKREQNNMRYLMEGR